MSLGAFLAGVLLADSEFRHELEANVEPFKGLLLGLFFMAVGMSANLAYLVGASDFGARRRDRLDGAQGIAACGQSSARPAPATRTRSGSAVLLAQGGEFAFVLFTAAQATGILTGKTAQFLVLTVTISMLLAPLVIRRARAAARALDRTAQAARIRCHRRPRQSGDHRGVRTLRPDRVAGAAYGRHIRSPRSK